MPHKLLRDFLMETINKMQPRHRTYVGAAVLISTVGYATMREVERLLDHQQALNEQQSLIEDRGRAQKEQSEDRDRALKVQTEDREREQKVRDIENLVKVNSLCAEYNKS